MSYIRSRFLVKDAEKLANLTIIYIYRRAAAPLSVNMTDDLLQTCRGPECPRTEMSAKKLGCFKYV